MKQRRHLRNRISATTAATFLSVALAGATCGTFAWFTYDTRAKIFDELQGVTIGFGEIEIGIISEVDLPEAEMYGLEKEPSSSEEAIYWFQGRKMEPDTINYVLSANGYATETLIPVTTRKYAKGDEFSLFSTPKMNIDEDEKAKKEGQVYLPLVFRYHDVLDDEGIYLPNQKIALSDVELSIFENDKHIHEAIRIYTDNRDGSSHLINPSSNNDGATDVGGTLDLDGDGFYDAEMIDEHLYEHIYGQVAESYYYSTPESTDTLPDNPDNENSFIAGHKAGVYALSRCVPERAEYEGITGFNTKSKWVTTTNPQTNNYAYLNLSIFVEGWDSHVINCEQDIPFSIKLNFEAIV